MNRCHEHGQDAVMWDHLATVEDVEMMRQCILEWGISAAWRQEQAWSATVRKMALALELRQAAIAKGAGALGLDDSSP